MAPENETQVKNKFLDKMKDKHEKLGKEEVSKKAKEIRVDGLVDDMNSFPGRIHLAGPIGSTSVKEDKKNHNPLHGGDGKYMGGKDIGKENKSNKFGMDDD